jgi:hypothetical protein
MRPKLLAIQVSGCHLIPVILRASSRGRQERAGGHGQRDVTQRQVWPFRPYGRYAYSSGVGAIDHVCAVPVWRITEFR